MITYVSVQGTPLDHPRVLLIWPYGVSDAESIPMCMAYLVPQVMKLGIPVTVLDCSLSGLHPNSIAFSECIKDYNPDIVGISSWSQNWRWTGMAVKAIRDMLPGIPIVLGGPHVTATGSWGEADYSLMGEAEYTLPALILSLFSPGERDKLDIIPGLRGPNLLNTAPQAIITDLDELGLPRYEAMLLKPYQNKGYRYRDGTKLQAPVLATRGCPYICSFCIEENQRVLMANWSWKAIKDVKVGERVMSYHEANPDKKIRGRIAPTTVRAVHDNGVKDTVEILSETQTIVCTPDHKIYAWDGHKTRWKNAGNLREDVARVRIFSPRNNDNSEYRRGWCAGYLAGDGCIHKRGGLQQITITSRDTELLDTVQAWGREFGCNLRRFKHKMGKGIFPTKLDSESIDAVQCTSGPEVDVFLEKILPSGYEDDSDDYKRGWIAGMYDADGYMEGDSCRIIQSSEANPDKCYRIRRYLIDLNVDFSQHTDGRKMNVYSLNVPRFLGDFRPVLTRKYPDGYGFRSLYQEDIISVDEDYGKARVYDLTTDSHTYIVEGFIVHNCEAPLLSGRKIRKHSIAYLEELLSMLHTNFDVTHINIVDDNFTFYKNYAKEFCQMVLRNRDKLGEMTFATPNGIRVERSDLEMFQMLKAAGWSSVIFAPESGSQRMVDIMAKHLDLGVVAGKVEEAHKAGLEVEAFFILNYPGETDKDVEETEQFIKKIKFDSVSLHIFKPLPHTPIWRQLVDEQQLSPDYIIGRYDEIDWLANGRTRADIAGHIRRYQASARRVERIA